MIPLFKFKIKGHSMEPAFQEGDMVLVSSLPYLFGKPKTGDVVLLEHERYIIKRIEKINGEKIFVVGDNKRQSTDSRSFGWVDRKKLLGKVTIKL